MIPKIPPRKYWLPLFVLAWVVFQMGLTKFSALNPWKLGGYGMYSDYHPEDYHVWFHLDGNPILARNTKLFSSDPVFKKRVLICRTYPSTANLKKLHGYFKNNSKEHLKIEIWSLKFASDSLKLERVLINSYEN